MVRSKIDKKRKIIEDKKRAEKELLRKRRKIEKNTFENEKEEKKKDDIERPDEIIGLIIFLIIPNIILPLVSFIFTLIILFWLLLNNDALFLWLLASALLYIGTATLTGLTSYWLYHLKKFSYYLGIGIAVVGFITSLNMLFVLNPAIIIFSIISMLFNGISIYFLLFYQEIRGSLGIKKY